MLFTLAIYSMSSTLDGPAVGCCWPLCFCHLAWAARDAPCACFLSIRMCLKTAWRLQNSFRSWRPRMRTPQYGHVFCAIKFETTARARCFLHREYEFVRHIFQARINVASVTFSKGVSTEKASTQCIESPSMIRCAPTEAEAPESALAFEIAEHSDICAPARNRTQHLRMYCAFVAHWWTLLGSIQCTRLK